MIADGALDARVRARTTVKRMSMVDKYQAKNLIRNPSSKKNFQGPIAKSLLEDWFPNAELIPVVDFCLAYSRHLRHAPLPGADRNTSLEMTATIC